MTETTIDQLEREIPALRRFARALVGHPDRADDLVQDTLERALTRIDSYTPGTNMRAWLFTILRNNHINDLRRARMTATAPESLEAMMPPGEAGQEHGIALDELSQALSRLSAEMREVILLIGLEGMSYEEAADVLKVKVGTVKSRLCRGREALRKLLDGTSVRHEDHIGLGSRGDSVDAAYAAIMLAFNRLRPAYADSLQGRSVRSRFSTG